jgi:GT2 family glycosyltransferase
VVAGDWLRHIVAPLRDERVGIAGGKVLAKRPCNSTAAFGEYIHDHDRAINVARPPYVATANWSSPSSVLREVGGFDESFLRGQDSELSVRILRAGYQLVYVQDAVVYHKNKDTFVGLFLEGYRHGVWSIRLLKRHERFLKQWDYCRFRVRTYSQLLGHLGRALVGPGRHSAACHAVFGTGKELGKLWGSARSLYTDL